MSRHPEPHPQADQTVLARPAAAVWSHTTAAPFRYRVEDWADRVFQGSWMDMEGNPAALGYAVRSAVGGLPTDDDVVYGKDQRGIGHLLHSSELAVDEPADEKPAS